MGDAIEPIYKRLGGEIRDMRIARGMTQGDLADAIGMSRGSVANTEVGRQRLMLHQIAEIADVLGVPFGDLVIEARSASGGAQYRVQIAAQQERITALENQIRRAKLALGE